MFSTAPSVAEAQSAGLPQWLRLSGAHRMRYEHLRHQFVQNAPGNDAALSLRTTLQFELQLGFWFAGVELADSRVYLSDEDTPIGTSHVNPTDMLQAYIGTTIPNLIASGNLRFRLGRQAANIGSRRFVARNRFRNTINARTGIDLEWSAHSGETILGFVTVPVERRIGTKSDNDPRFDIERTESVFWGVVARSRETSGKLRGALQLYGLHEKDSDRYSTANRNLLTPAIRLMRAPSAGSTDFEIEAALQIGTSRSTREEIDSLNLDHRAFFVHMSVAHTFSFGWQPRVKLLYDYATGDSDPNDGKNGRFDTLYGARRFEYGPTGIYGAFARSNINSPGIRVEVRPTEGLSGFVGYRRVWLAQARDRWVPSGLRDVDGSAGTLLGDQIEGRARWLTADGLMSVELGFAHLCLGDFPTNTLRATGRVDNPTYLYAQVTFRI